MTVIQASARNSNIVSSQAYDNQVDTQSLTSGVRTVETIEGLSAISAPTSELVIWERTLSLGFRDWLERLETVTLPDLRILVERKDICRALEPLLDGCNMPSGKMRDLLAGDVFDLACSFVDITGSELVDIRLELVEHDACWKFHRDSVETRLLTTYRGPTTEWVQPKYADHAEQEQKEFKGPIEQLGLFDVAIFKGRYAGPNVGIVHRSPPIEGTGQTRLLLCLNNQSISSPELWTGP